MQKLPLILVLVAFATAARGEATPQSPPRPNIVVVLVDDMGWSDIGCYGGEIPTPNIDALAEQGVRFTQFYNTARCSPTRASLLTGLYPHQAGMGHLDNIVHKGTRGTQGRLRDDSVTIAEVLSEAGYFTAMTGKWHLGQQHGTPPWDQGFMRTLNSPKGGVYFPNQPGPSQIFLDGEPHKRDDSRLGEDWYGTDLWTEWGLKFVDEALEAEKPFFLYIAQCAPHFPLMAPQEDIDRYRGKYLVGWEKFRNERHQRQLELGLVDPNWELSPLPPELPEWDSLSDEEKDRLDHIMAIYAAMIDRIDHSIGTLVNGLEERGALENTLILFLSDNGGNAEAGPRGRYQGERPGGPDSNVFLGQCWATLNNTPFRRYKHFTHEGGISTPLIAHWPNGISPERRGKLERQPGHVVDIMATVVELAGASYPAEYKGHAIQAMEGVSLTPAFAGESLQRENPLYFAHEGNRAVRKGKWKLVMRHPGPWELYDIEADRTEQRDRIDDHPELAAELAADWEAWAERADVGPWPGPLHNEAGDVIRRRRPNQTQRGAEGS